MCKEDKKIILVLFGGCSTEYEVSLQSAAAMLEHMDPAKFRALPVGITRDGRWLRYRGPVSALPADGWQRQDCVPCTLTLDRGGCTLLWLDGSDLRESFDAAFPILHGKNGEDGTVQGLFSLAGVPVIGCGVLSSALCMDKDRAHKLAALAGVEVPKSTVFRRDAAPEEIAAAADKLGYPLFVKPVRAGSSFGISRVSRLAELDAAVAEAFRHDSEVLLEEAIPGFEVGCAVMGNDALTVGAVDEIELSRGFFNFEEKYTLKTSAIHCPARITPETAAAIRDAARTLYRALGCRGFARVDLFLTPEGRIVFNEINTIPGFTAHSRYPNMMKAAGLDFSALVTRLIELGVQPE
ncbi:MAG: D-alanine--D-serine ligase VanG [Gemmiger sp.]